MDFSWLIWLLVVVLVLALGYVIIKHLIMPAIPAPMQVWVWAIIGVGLLIALLIFVGGHWGNLGSHGVSIH